MRQLFCLFLFIWIIFLSGAYGAQVPGQIIVKFKPGVVGLPHGMRAASVSTASVKAASINALNSQNKVYRLKQLYAKILEIKPEWTDLADYYILEFPTDKRPDDVAASYQQDKNVLNASPNIVFHAYTTTPNDPRYLDGSQWGLTKIKAPQAWDFAKGSTAIKIAVLDTGVNYNHEDLASQVDLTDAYNFVNDTSDPMDDHTDFHGSTVAGVIGAATNNDKGIAGVNWQVKIVPIKVLDHAGSGTMDNILLGINWARAKGVKIMNMSFGQYLPDSMLEQACQNAYNDGIVLVSAAGNGNVDWPSYPAYYSTVIAVGAVDTLEARSIWSGVDPNTHLTQASNYGSWVDVCAPGTSILSTYKGTSQYSSSSGTSLASPFVAGVAGLILSINPALTNRQVYDRITIEADPVTTDQPIGKRLNAYLATLGIEAEITAPSAETYIKGSVNIAGTAAGWDFKNYIVSVLAGTSEAVTVEAGSVAVENGHLATWDSTAFNGTVTIELMVYSNTGTTRESTVTVIADNSSPEAIITYPTSGLSLAGKVTVLGTASDQYFDHYILQYGQGSSPTAWQTITTGYSVVTSGRLGTWETIGLNGTYTLKLSSFDKVGTTTARQVSVTLANVTPTDKHVVPQQNLPLTYPLPATFNRQVTALTTMNYTLSSNFDVRLYIFDLTGTLIWQQAYVAGENGAKAGNNNPNWAGTTQAGLQAPNGLYLYQIVADQRVLARGHIIIFN